MIGSTNLTMVNKLTALLLKRSAVCLANIRLLSVVWSWIVDVR